jgi:hypothetical protein
MYFVYPPLQYDLERGGCSIQGVVGKPALETDPGYRAITDVAAKVLSISTSDIPDAVHAVDEVIDGVQVPGIALHAFYKGGGKPVLVNPSLKLSCTGFWRGHLLQVCLAAPPSYDDRRVPHMFLLWDGATHIPIDKYNISVDPLEAVVDAFDERMPLWTDACQAFAKLNHIPQYAAHVLFLVTINLEGLTLAADPTDLLVGFGNDLPEHSAQTLVVGPLKLTPSAEHQRVISDTQIKQALQRELNEYLSDKDKPLSRKAFARTRSRLHPHGDLFEDAGRQHNNRTPGRVEL